MHIAGILLIIEVMPHVEISAKSFFGDVFTSPRLPDLQMGTRNWLWEKAAICNVELLGVGGDSIVIKNKSGETVEAGFSGNYSPTSALFDFYSNRILNTLFPKKFARMRAVFWGESQSYTGKDTSGHHIPGSVREYIPGKPTGYFENLQNTFSPFICNPLKWGDVVRVLTTPIEHLSRTPFYRVEQELREAGLNYEFDVHPGNILKRTDQEQVYIDRAVPHLGPGDSLADFFGHDKEARVTEYMRRKGYSSSDILKVQKSFQRLQSLPEIVESHQRIVNERKMKREKLGTAA